MKRSIIFLTNIKSRRGASKLPDLETVIIFISIALIALAILYGSFEKEESNYELADNGRIYVVSTKQWGYKELSRYEMRYNDTLDYWEIKWDGEWFDYDALNSGEGVDRY